MAESPPQPPPFTPVPVRARRDGWTPERQRRFIAALAETRSAGRAARAVGMSREGAYQLRGRPGAESFVAAWDAALAWRPPTAPDPWERGVKGVLVPVFRGRLQRGVVRRFDDGALLKLLRNVYRVEARRRRG
jgi:hypothetical protein